MSLRSIETSYEGEAAGSAEWKTLRDGANAKFISQQYAQAGEKYSDALMFISLTDRPARIHLLNNRALAHLNASKFNQAIWDCESVIHLAPPSASGGGGRSSSSAAMIKSLYIKGLVYKEKGDAETALSHLRQAAKLCGTDLELLASSDRAHLQTIIKELSEQLGEGGAGTGINTMPSQLWRRARRLAGTGADFLFWSISPLVLLVGTWLFVSVWACSSAVAATEGGGFILDVQRAQLMSGFGAVAISTCWQMWTWWEQRERERRGEAFVSIREEIRGWWAVSRALGLAATARLVVKHGLRATQVSEAPAAPSTNSRWWRWGGGGMSRSGGGGRDGHDERARLRDDLANITKEVYGGGGGGVGGGEAAAAVGSAAAAPAVRVERKAAARSAPPPAKHASKVCMCVCVCDM